MKRNPLPFVKMHGAGNDYVYMDSILQPEFAGDYENLFPDLARKISDRHKGIGSDGLILILPSEIADFKMRIFNADGSEAQMCGNGIRCVAKYVYSKHLTQKQTFTVETLAGIKTVWLNIEKGEVASITVDMGKPDLLPRNIPVESQSDSPLVGKEISIGDKVFNFTAVGMGNPHCVIFTNKITDELVVVSGPKLEVHSLFPQKTNVEFIEVKDPKRLSMRVWERGSGETMACGTGACASVVAAFLNGLTGREVVVELRGGHLKIKYDETTGHIFMTGEAEFIAEGSYFYNKPQ